MLMFVAVSALLSVVSAGYGGGYSGGYGAANGGFIAPASGSYGFALAPVALGRVGGCRGLGGGCGRRGFAVAGGAVVNAAVQTHHNVEYREAPSGGVIHPTMVEVDASPIPVQLVFRSASSLLNVQQNHLGSQGSVQESVSEDEPHILRHSVTKPVIQEIREIVTPFRKIAQEIRPVQEQIDTTVARGVGGVSGVSGGNGGFGLGGGNGGFAVSGGNGGFGLGGGNGGFAVGGGNGGFSLGGNGGFAVSGGNGGFGGNSFALGAPATFARAAGNGGSAEY